MKKDGFIERWGIEAYEKRLKQSHEWRLANPERVKKHCGEQYRKGGKYYLKHLIYERTGIRGMRKRVRNKQQKRWRKYKDIIAQGSQLYYLWVADTVECKCVALVETDQYQYPFKDAIHIQEISKGLIPRFLIPKFLTRKRLSPLFTEGDLQK